MSVDTRTPVPVVIGWIMGGLAALLAAFILDYRLALPSALGAAAGGFIGLLPTRKWALAARILEGSACLGLAALAGEAFGGPVGGLFAGFTGLGLCLWAGTRPGGVLGGVVGASLGWALMGAAAGGCDWCMLLAGGVATVTGALGYKAGAAGGYLGALAGGFLGLAALVFGGPLGGWRPAAAAALYLAAAWLVGRLGYGGLELWGREG